ncbi:MbtH family protein [Streptacidiphilus sp. EB129]|uniref:MbtH family protein n=1 Tax=Streptacidiphilus sp. EB129 TaxID=3156262 RepID=UPI00351945A7
MTDVQSDDRTYLVVHNDEEQYSIWEADRELPAGWHPEGTRAGRAECLARIEEVWTDMRPLSLRRRMEQDGSSAA